MQALKEKNDKLKPGLTSLVMEEQDC